jgi:hypothetical protein
MGPYCYHYFFSFPLHLCRRYLDPPSRVSSEGGDKGVVVGVVNDLKCISTN